MWGNILSEAVGSSRGAGEGRGGEVNSLSGEGYGNGGKGELRGIWAKFGETGVDAGVVGSRWAAFTEQIPGVSVESRRGRK